MPVLLSWLSSCSQTRLPRPGRPAPLRAFGPGSRSCDVISKASALSSDTQPCPAGPGSQALFTELRRGEGRRNGPGLLWARLPWQPPAWPLLPPPPPSLHVLPPKRLRPEAPAPCPGHPLPTHQARRMVAIFLHFAIPAPSTKPWVEIKAAQVRLTGSGGERHVQNCRTPAALNVLGLSNTTTPEAEREVSSRRHPAEPNWAELFTPPLRPGSLPRPEASPPPSEEKNWRRPMGGQEGS